MEKPVHSYDKTDNLVKKSYNVNMKSYTAVI